jgi:hypothetical protein
MRIRIRRATPDRFFRGSITSAVLYLTSGPIVWAIHLTLVYGTHTLVCTQTPSGGADATFAVLAVTARALVAIFVALAASAAAQRRAGHDSPLAFYHRATTWLAWLSAFGVACAGATALIVEPCLALR